MPKDFIDLGEGQFVRRSNVKAVTAPGTFQSELGPRTDKSPTACVHLDDDRTHVLAYIEPEKILEQLNDKGQYYSA